MDTTIMFTTTPAPIELEHGSWKLDAPVNAWDFLSAAIESGCCRCAGYWQHQLRNLVGETQNCSCRRCNDQRRVITTRLIWVLFSLINPDFKVTDSKGRTWGWQCV